MEASQVSISVQGLTRYYDAKSPPAINNINLEITGSQIFGLLGPNGAGKTTTLSILCGLLKPGMGKVLINGLDITTKLKTIRKNIGVVPQETALYPTLTAFENLKFIGNMYGLRGNELNRRIEECLEQFGLKDKTHVMIRNFSGGMKKRLNLIAGILHRPRILFLDEPTAGTDVQSKNKIREFVKYLNNDGTMIIYTSHLMEEVENLCSQIAILDDGIIIAQGVPSDLVQHYECENLEHLFLKLTGKSLRD